MFNAQTSSTARDLFYKYDALGHFQSVMGDPEAAHGISTADVSANVLNGTMACASVTNRSE